MLDFKDFRGYSIIGLYQPSKEINVGHALRAAGALNAKAIFIGQGQYKRTITDTSKTYRHIPLMFVDDLKEVVPYDCTPVAVEMVEGATPLPEFVHPERAFYIYGPELGSLSQEMVDFCKEKIIIPSNFSLNLGSAVYITLYDRMAKQYVREKETLNRKAIFGYNR